MFKLDPNPTFTHPVDVFVPVDGGHDKQTFKATFRVGDAGADNEHDLSTAAGSTAWLRALLVEMGDLVDATDQPLPYSDAVRDQLLKLPYVRLALVRAYNAAVTKAAVGN